MPFSLSESGYEMETAVLNLDSFHTQLALGLEGEYQRARRASFRANSKTLSAWFEKPYPSVDGLARRECGAMNLRFVRVRFEGREEWRLENYVLGIP